MIFERTNYFAKPGQREAVLAMRRNASAVRVALGLPPGAIFVKAEGDGPDVSWQCAFADAAAHAADLKAREESEAFERVRAEMRAVIQRFERHVDVRDGGLGGSIGERSLAGQPIVPRELAFESGNLTLKGYLYLPPGPGPFACMIRNHGSGIAQGSSDVSRPGTAKYDDQIARRLDAESNDVLAALDFVRTLPEIDADHIGVMGSSFGGVNTLLAAAKTDKFRCGIDFAGAAMNWDRTPRLRQLMTEAALRLQRPMFFIQAATDYSIRPTVELAAALAGAGKEIQSKVYPEYGFNRDEGHLFESTGQLLWGPDVRQFLERWL